MFPPYHTNGFAFGRHAMPGGRSGKSSLGYPHNSTAPSVHMSNDLDINEQNVTKRQFDTFHRSIAEQYTMDVGEQAKELVGQKF